MPPPALFQAVFPLKVLPFTVSVPSFSMPPPAPLVTFGCNCRCYKHFVTFSGRKGCFSTINGLLGQLKKVWEHYPDCCLTTALENAPCQVNISDLMPLVHAPSPALALKRSLPLTRLPTFAKHAISLLDASRAT